MVEYSPYSEIPGLRVWKSLEGIFSEIRELILFCSYWLWLLWFSCFLWGFAAAAAVIVVVVVMFVFHLKEGLTYSWSCSWTGDLPRIIGKCYHTQPASSFSSGKGPGTCSLIYPTASLSDVVDIVGDFTWLTVKQPMVRLTGKSGNLRLSLQF